jgi:vitamin B12 transporter
VARPLFMSLVLVLAVPAGAAAQYAAEAVVEAPMATTNDEDATAAGTAIPVDYRRPTHAGASMQQVLYEAPGAQVISTGALGQFAGVSLRGAGMEHTAVLLGELPLTGPDAGAFDFSLVPLAYIERVEVYRGGAPVWLGDGGIGGVVRLMPRRAEGTEVGVLSGGGSFGTHATNVHAAAGDERVASFVSVGMRGTRGNFPYLDDGGTRLDPDDDVMRRRRNAEALDGHGLVHLEAEVGGGKLQVAGIGISRAAGEPGPGSAPALQAERWLSRSVGVVGWTHARDTGRRPHRFQVAMGGGYERDRLTDLFGEVGISQPRATDDRRSTAFGRVAGGVQLLPWLEVTSVASVRRDGYAPDNRLAVAEEGDSLRTTGAVAGEARLHGRVGKTGLELRPSVRLERSVAQIRGERGATTYDRDVRELLPTVRVGAAVAPLPWLSFSSAFATGRRLPSILELFGNRSTIVANPGLDPERSIGGDVGVVARGRAGPLAGMVEVRGFRQRIDDLIRFRRTSQFAVIAENEAQGRIQGVEAALRGRAGEHLALAGTVQWLDTENERGHPIALRPRLTGFLRPEVHSGPLGRLLDDAVLSLEVIHVGGFPLDGSNLAHQQPRTWLALGVRVDTLNRALTLSFAVQDLLDARGDDLLGWPLPGRRYTAQVAYVKELGR